LGILEHGFDSAIYEQLPLELRLMALGLKPPSPRGRPRALSFRQRLAVAVRWGEVRAQLARRGRSTRRPELAPILKQIGRQRAKNALPWRIAELSRKADQVGRYHSTPVLPPDEPKPAIDRMVAQEFGITERMVRKLRSDPKLQPFIGPEPWVPRVWEVAEAKRASLRRQAAHLLTPERLAKAEIGDRYVDGAWRLTVLDEFERGVYLLTPRQLEVARKFQKRCYWGGLRHPVLAIKGTAADEFGSWVRRGLAGDHGGSEYRIFFTRWRNLLIEKLLGMGRHGAGFDGVRFIDYNRSIVDRVSPRGLWLLRELLQGGRPLKEIASLVGLRTEQELVQLLARVLDLSVAGSVVWPTHYSRPFGRWSEPRVEETLVPPVGSPRWKIRPRSPYVGCLLL
jgi:hypothetical protein